MAGHLGRILILMAMLILLTASSCPKNYGTGELGADAPLANRDANRDGLINFEDFLLLSDEFGK